MKSPHRRSKRRWLRFELLEDRRLLANIDLAGLTAAQGVAIYGADAGDESGFSVSRVGDVNRDGFDDWLIGAPRANGSTNTLEDAGEAYLIFGGPSIASTIDLGNVGTTVPGTKFFGVGSYDATAMAVSSAGDVNGDGFQDLMIGAYEADGSGNAKRESGESYLIFGKTTWPATTNLSTVGTTTAGIRFLGVDAEDYSGCSVGSAGDVNGDGFDDLLIGAYKADGATNTIVSAGESYLLFGAASFAGTIDLATIGTTVAGAKLFGVEADDYSGRSVSSAGDFNGDGFDDLVIGAPYADAALNARASAGDVYVIFGGVSMAASISLANVGSSVPGITLSGSRAGDYTGRSVSGAGDVNGDGFDDLIVGAHFGDAKDNLKEIAGDSFLIFGSNLPPVAINLANVGGSVPGVKFYGADSFDQSGLSVSGAGDFNGDGFDDLLIGAYSADGASNLRSNSGETYLVFGAATLPSEIDQFQVGISISGLIVYGADVDDFSGRSVSGIGDVNGDGFSDLLIGASRGDGAANAKFYAGESYVIYGKNETLSVTHPGTANAETLTGTSGINVMIGGRGDDILLGLGGADVQRGGEGNDILAISDLTFRRIVGGTGDDTLRLDGSGLSLNLTTLQDNRILGIESIDISGTGVNSLTLNAREVLNLSSESNTLLVRRNFGDNVNIGSGWTQGSNQVIGGSSFAVYTQGQATLRVQEVVNASIINRQVFYHRSLSSLFGDGSGNPVNAIDPSKQALMPGQETSTANYTNYAKGLNGIIVDVANLPGLLTASDFQFATWDGIDATGFVASAAVATISVLPGQGNAGSSRVKIEFGDGVIRNTWLRVTMLANVNTGLANADVFYFGNAVGDMYAGNVGTPITVRTNATDTATVRQNQSTFPNSAGISSPYDVNKDGRVNSTDTSIVRQNLLNQVIRYFTAPLNFQTKLGTEWPAEAFSGLNSAETPSDTVSRKLRLSRSLCGWLGVRG